MTYWQGLLLGLVQGLTEFLPVSSSGHLVFVETVLGVSTPGVVVEVVLHIATLLAVVVVYRSRLMAIGVGVARGDRNARRYVGLLAIGSVPAAVVGLAFADLFERAFDSLFMVGCSFVVTGAVLWSTRWIRTVPAADTPSATGAAGIGIAQALAIFPGISRSGTTVATGLWLGVRPEAAAEFSFLLAVPAIAGAGLLQLPDLSSATTQVGWGPLSASFLVALLSGVFAIRFLITLLRRRAFHRFAPYCWGLGAVTVWWALVM